jgi:pheromone shutdown protein TraB
MNQSQLSKEEKLSTIIELCNDIEIDGETMEYVLRSIGMEDQMLRQLIMEAPMLQVQELIDEKTSFI